jgi:fluoride exporter
VILALLVGLAGGLGAVGRFGLDQAISARTRSVWPTGTFCINVSGSLVLGLLTGLLWYHGLSGRVLAVGGVGACGGFTTWSTACWESVRLLLDHSWRHAALYTLGALAAAVAAAAIGLALAAL